MSGEMVQSNLPFIKPEAVYRQYKSADEIEYTPERALQEGIAMVQDLGEHLKRLDVGSKLRKEVWAKEVDTCVFLLFHNNGSILLSPQLAQTKISANHDRGMRRYRCRKIIPPQRCSGWYAHTAVRTRNLAHCPNLRR